MSKIIIGVDAGGTKTLGVAFDEKGEELFRVAEGLGSPAVDKNLAIVNISLVIEKLAKKIKASDELFFIQIGMSGMGTMSEEDKSNFLRVLEDKYHTKAALDNDAVIGLYSIIKNEYKEGVLVLSGTGSAVFGKNRLDVTMLSGGWGHLLNEQGSAFSVVSNAVIKLIDDFERNQKLSAFQKKLLEKFEITDPFDIKKIWYKKTKNELASYAKFINDEALQNDSEAKRLLEDSGRSLGTYVINLCRKLGIKENFIIGFRGGFVNNASFIKQSFKNFLKEEHLKPIYETEETEPIIGTYYLALTRL